MRPAFKAKIFTSTNNEKYKKMTELMYVTTGGIFGLFSYPHSSEMLKRFYLQVTRTHEYLRDCVDDWPYPVIILILHQTVDKMLKETEGTGRHLFMGPILNIKILDNESTILLLKISAQKLRSYFAQYLDANIQHLSCTCILLLFTAHTCDYIPLPKIRNYFQ